MIKFRKWFLLGIIAFILCIIPLYISEYILTMFNFILLNAIITLGLGLLIGHAGQVSLGHNAFYGLGAYTSAILSYRFGIPVWPSILCGMILSGGIAYFIGKPILKLHGYILVIATFAVGLIFFILFGELEFITEGYQGFSHIPRPSIGKFVFVKSVHYYYLFLVITTTLHLSALNFSRTKLGRECRAIDLYHGGSEIVAMTLGINVGKLKNQIFTLSAVYAGLAGGLYVHYLTHIDPGPFNLWSSITFVIIVIIGGAKSVWGPLIGSIFFVGLKELISISMKGLTDISLHGYEVVIFSVIFVFVLLTCPDGLISLPSLLGHKKGFFKFIIK
jgi:branched-chain amino acid transport system permease protein